MMADDVKPWEKYAATAAPSAQPANSAAPWEHYAAAQPAPQAAMPTASQPAQQPVEAATPQRNMTQNFLRSLGLAARMPLQAAGSTAGMVGDALSTAVNMGGQAIGHNPNLPMPSGLIQHGIDAITPTPEGFGEKAADFIGSTVAGGLGRGVDPLARMATKGFTGATAKLLSQRDQVTRAAQQAGLVVTPSTASGGKVGTFLEGIAGKKRLETAANVKNQDVIDAIASRAIDMPPGTNLPSTIGPAIQSMYDEGYGPIKALGNISTGGVYRRALDKVANDFHGASNSFPSAVNNDVRSLVDSYRVHNFDSNDAVSAIQGLRKDASDAYRNGNSNLMGANKGIANAIEDNIALNLNSRGENGQEILGSFQDARRTLAKQKAVQETLDPGTGNVSALKMARKLSRGAPLTDGLDLIGQFGSNYPSLAGIPKHLSVPHTHQNNILAALTGMLAGPAAGAGVAAAPIGGAALRALMLSPMGQRMIGPSVNPGMFARMAQSPEMMNALPTAYTQSGLYGPRN